MQNMYTLSGLGTSAGKVPKKIPTTAYPQAQGTPQVMEDKAQTDINRYESATYDYPVTLLRSPGNLYAQNFDRQRQAAQQQINAGVSSGTATGMAALASSGGLSAADRKAIEAQGQRQQVELSQGAMNPYDQAAAQNLYDTSQFNALQEQTINDQNAATQNQAARDKAAQYETKAANIYAQRMKEALLERQLDAARIIAGRQ